MQRGIVRIKMTTIYLTSSGEYSSWHVTGAFSTKEKAEEYARQTNSDNDVDEYVVDEEFDPARVGLRMHRVFMWANGDVLTINLNDYEDEEKAFATCNGRGEWDVTVYCYARDEQHAIKIANEKRIGLILEGKLPACAP